MTKNTVLEIKELRRIFKRKRKELGGEWSKLRT
jgi:hypothetical protein